MIMGSGRSVFLLAAAMFVVAGLGLTSCLTNGFKEMRFERNPDAAAIFELDAAFQDELNKWLNPKTTVPCFQLSPPYDMPKADFFARNGCLIRNTGKSAVLLMGDSHSASLSLGLRHWAQSNKVDFLQTSGFYPLGLFCINQDQQRTAKVCDSDYSRAAMETIKAAKPDILVVDMYWSQASTVALFPNMDDYLNHILSTYAEEARELGVKKVIIVGEIPCWTDNLPHLLLRNFVEKHKAIPERTFVGIEEKSLQMDATMRKLKMPPNFLYFSLRDVLCNSDGCLTRVGNNLRTDLMAWDYGHMTESSSTYVTEHGLGDFIMRALNT